VNVRSCFRLPGLPNKPLAFDSWRGTSRFFSKAFSLFHQALIEWGRLFETASLLLHGAAPFLKEGGSATGDLITDKCHGTGR